MILKCGFVGSTRLYFSAGNRRPSLGARSGLCAVRSNDLYLRNRVPCKLIFWRSLLQYWPRSQKPEQHLDKPGRRNQAVSYVTYSFFFVCFWRDSPQWAKASSFTRFLDHTQWHTTVGRTPLDERLARRRDLYLTTHNTHNRQTSIPPVGFEPAVSAGERPQTYALDRAATGIGDVHFGGANFKFWPEDILRLVTKNNIPVLCTIFVLLRPPPPPTTFPVLLYYRRYKLIPMNQ